MDQSKLKLNKKGETFIETLVSLLIVVLVVSGFTTIIASIARFNDAVKSERYAVNDSKANPQSGWTLNLKDSSGNATAVSVQGYCDIGNRSEKVYYYYE